jgi:4-diphosphocytidyl-2-C-methyl-D-erythritol kinase
MNRTNEAPIVDKDTGWPAPAKLNLFLHITGQREDGYHLLQSVFQFIQRADKLYFELRDDGQIKLSEPLEGVADEDNLVVKAVRQLQQHCQPGQGATIRIEKVLPMGGGLGGGSSDAATALVALNLLWKCGLDNTQLAQIGLKLGADVPIFILGQSAWAEGVGEQLTPVLLPEPWFVVLSPQIEVSTAEIFSLPQLQRDCTAITIRDFLAGTKVTNVCEPVVRQQYPIVDEALEQLSKYAPARMTGTGACVFAMFENEVLARKALESLDDKWSGFVTRGVNLSPLKEMANKFCDNSGN